jgi:hypothetical protein
MSGFELTTVQYAGCYAWVFGTLVKMPAPNTFHKERLAFPATMKYFVTDLLFQDTFNAFYEPVTFFSLQSLIAF